MPSLEAQPRTCWNRMERTRLKARSATGFQQKAQSFLIVTTWKICGWFSREVSFSSYAEIVLSKNQNVVFYSDFLVFFQSPPPEQHRRSGQSTQSVSILP